jgi:hypothetical protein
MDEQVFLSPFPFRGILLVTVIGCLRTAALTIRSPPPRRTRTPFAAMQLACPRGRHAHIPVCGVGCKCKRLGLLCEVLGNVCVLQRSSLKKIGVDLGRLHLLLLLCEVLWNVYVCLCTYRCKGRVGKSASLVTYVLVS